jgi:hypothetical protein
MFINLNFIPKNYRAFFPTTIHTKKKQQNPFKLKSQLKSKLTTDNFIKQAKFNQA